jgi:hypothetical protein
MACSGTVVGLGPASIRLAWTGRADENGGQVIDAKINAGACGTYLQALDVDVCCLSDVVTIE